MGPRVRIVLVALSLLAVTALAVPLATSIADRRTAALAAERGRQLSSLAAAASMPDAPLQRLVDRYHQVYGEGVLIVDADGRPVAAQGLSPSDPGVATAITQALVDAPSPHWGRVLPWHQDRLLAADGVRRDGDLVGAAVLSADPAAAAREVARDWIWLALGCLFVLLVAVVVARSLTRWVLRPINGLERAVAEMTEGVDGLPAQVAGPAELRHFTTAFNTMTHTVRASLDRQRRLISDASHQLRNPLAAVRLRADSLDGCVTDAGRVSYQSMSAELDRLENLLQQLLRLARAEEVSGSRRVGLSVTSAESTHLDDVIQERISFWRPVADRNGQHLHFRTVHPGLIVALTRHDIEQLLDVALDNALRYSGAGATITVSTRQPDTPVELVISDDGPGLTDDELPKATARFWRGDVDRTGTGLGLAIAAEIAAGHGGTLAVQRASEGGLAVCYRLPEAGAATC